MDNKNRAFYNRVLFWIKFTLSVKATKIDKIFTVNLTLCSNRQISSIFVAFLENMNFKKKKMGKI